jgi:hypothetical protein
MSVVGGGRATACRCGELTRLCHVWREGADIPHISGVYFAISMRTINGSHSMRPAHCGIDGSARISGDVSGGDERWPGAWSR